MNFMNERISPTANTAMRMAVAWGICLLHGASVAWAQGGVQAGILIQGFDVLGDNPLSSGETARALSPYLRKPVTLQTLQEATQALEQVLRDSGHSLYRVSLPAQELSTDVRLSIVSFTIGQIKIENPGAYSENNIRSSVPELKVGQSPNVKRLALQTALANENPGKQITVVLKESELAGKVDAHIQVAPTKPWSLSVTQSNTGTPSTGRDRITFAGTHSNLWDSDHQFTGAYTTSLQRPSDVRQYGLAYKLPMYRQGGMVAISATRSDVIGSFGAFTSTGAGHTLGLNYTQHLPATGSYRDFLTVSLDDKFFQGSQINGTAVGSDTRSRTLALGYGGKSQTEHSAWSFSLDWASNLPGGRANDLWSYTNGGTNNEISSHRWQGFRLNSQYALLTPSQWSWTIRGNAQIVNQAVIAGEQFGLGGSSSIRGTRERALAGDKGLLISAEVSTPDLGRGAKLAAFTDWGQVRDIRPNGTTKLPTDALSSVGLGLRVQGSPNFMLIMDYARLVKGSRVSLANNPSAPQKGDDKLHVNASWRF